MNYSRLTTLRSSLVFVLFVSLSATVFSQEGKLPPPNILWLTSEDHGPHLGCYGDDYATTPNIDAFA
ncbi:MAG: hypothetical protein ACPG6P_01050, partial [Akkermansiaceae bacterium]